MDLDDLDAPSQVPSRVSRFAPKFSKLKPKSKSELASAQESLGSVLPKTETDQTAPKPEPREFEAKKKELEIDSKPKPENGFVKMEVDSAAGAKEEPEENDSMEVEAEEDMVVREIDVFFNPKIDEGTQLYVLQYPLRPSWRPYELDERCEEVRVKPASSEVEMDLSLDVDSKNYDPDCGDRLNMTKQTLRCSWDQPRATRYAVGVLMGNKLHLNRIHAVMQLRPSLKHLISVGSKKKNNVTVDAEDTVKLEESSGKKVVGSSKKQIKQENSSVKQKISDEEGWVPLKYHGSESESSVRYLRKMAAQESSPLQFTMSPYDYLNSLCPGSCKNGNEPKGPSRRALLSLPLEERIKALLCEGPAPVHRFSVLKHFAPDGTTEEILDALQNHALLVQGLWAPKSSLLLGTSKETGGQRIARDYVLLLFWKNPVFSFSSLHFPSSLKTTVNKFLNILGVERPSVKDWKFKGQTDISFIKNYPDVVKKQEEVWGDLERDIMNMFGDGKSGRGPKNTSIPSRPVKPLNSDKGVTKGTSEVVGGKKIPDDIREVLCSKILPKVIQEHKVCSLQLMCQGLRELALNKLNLPKADDRFARAAACGTASPGELEKLLDETAINIHGLYVLKSSAEHPQYDPFRNVVIDLLRQNGLGAKLKKAEIFDAAKNTLKRDVTGNEYSKKNKTFGPKTKEKENEAISSRPSAEPSRASLKRCHVSLSASSQTSGTQLSPCARAFGVHALPPARVSSTRASPGSFSSPRGSRVVASLQSASATCPQLKQLSATSFSPCLSVRHVSLHSNGFPSPRIRARHVSTRLGFFSQMRLCLLGWFFFLIISLYFRIIPCKLENVLLLHVADCNFSHGSKTL